MDRRSALSGLLWGALPGLAWAAGAAPPVAATDRRIEAVIRSQLQAFAADDARKAYELAAPRIQQQFRTPEQFLAMVRQHYPVVYRHTAVHFLPPQRQGDRVLQQVHLTDGDDQVWIALYQLERQADRKTWRITGCIVQESELRYI